MTNEQKAIAATKAIAELLKKFQPAAGDPFGGVGPSASFMATHLPASVIQPAQLKTLTASIEKAAREGNMQQINQILGTVEKFISPLMKVVGL